jgi:hypothetical protein
MYSFERLVFWIVRYYISQTIPNTDCEYQTLSEFVKYLLSLLQHWKRQTYWLDKPVIKLKRLIAVSTASHFCEPKTYNELEWGGICRGLFKGAYG